MRGRRVLVTGATGLFGPYLVEEAVRRGADVGALGLRHGALRCDLTDSTAVDDLVGSGRFEVVINAAALTDVDGCERDPERADRLNAGIARNIARALPPSSQLVQVSTDQVYPDTAGPHPEVPTAPVNAYGRSKLAGEAAVLEHPRSLVLRTNIIGPSRRPHRSSLTDWALESLARGGAIDGFTDSWFSPLHLASAAWWVLAAVDADLAGPYNLGSRGGLTKFELLRRLAALHGYAEDRIRPTTATAVEGRAPRARDLRMDVRALEHALGSELPELADVILALGPQGPPPPVPPVGDDGDGLR